MLDSHRFLVEVEQGRSKKLFSFDKNIITKVLCMVEVCNQIAEAEASEKYHCQLLHLNSNKKNKKPFTNIYAFSSPSPCINHF